MLLPYTHISGLSYERSCITVSFKSFYLNFFTEDINTWLVFQPREKRIEIGLTYIYGIGRARSEKILSAAGVSPDTRVKDLTDEEVAKIRDVIDADTENLIEGDLRREIAMNIKRLKEIGCYRGIRHRKGLPVRGQKTKTNARTCKGPKKTVANKKK